MRSFEIASEVQQSLINSTVKSIWVDETSFRYNYLNTRELDFSIQLVCAPYVGKDPEKMITTKQNETITSLSNVLIVGDLTDITKIAAMNIIKFAFKYPWQKFIITVERRK